jgi:hypothetical protein
VFELGSRVGIKTFLEGPGNSHGAGNEMPAADLTNSFRLFEGLVSARLVKPMVN